MNKEEFDRVNIFGLGNPNEAFAKYFIGKSYLNPLVKIEDANLFLANVTFEPGSIVVIPANVKHWHGAKKDSWFSHIAMEIPGENTSTDWCEPVTDEEYNNL